MELKNLEPATRWTRVQSGEIARRRLIKMHFRHITYSTKKALPWTYPNGVTWCDPHSSAANRP